MAPTGLTALLDPVPGGESSHGLHAAGEGVDFPSQLALTRALLANDVSRVEGDEVLHERSHEVAEDKDRGQVGKQTPLLCV